jgi:hypothetical protein
MGTEITLEYVEHLKKHRVIHKELWSCHSKYAKDLFLGAETLRESYAAANVLRKELKQYVYPQMKGEKFEQKKLEKQVRTYNSSEFSPEFV